MASIDVEKVLSELTLDEKVSLLAGMGLSKRIVDRQHTLISWQAPISGILRPSASMESRLCERRMDQTA